MIKNYSDYSQKLKTNNLAKSICDTFTSDTNFKDFDCLIYKDIPTISKKDYSCNIEFFTKDEKQLIYNLDISFCLDSDNYYIIWIRDSWVDLEYKYLKVFMIFIQFLIYSFHSISGGSKSYFSFQGKSDDVNDLDEIITNINPERYEIFKQSKKFNV